jgi:hypothetical protein
MKKFHSNTVRIENMPITGDNLSQKEKEFLKSRSGRFPGHQRAREATRGPLANANAIHD